MRNCFGWCIDCRRRSLNSERWRKSKPQQAINRRTVPPIDPVEFSEKDFIFPSNLESFTFDEIKKITNFFCQDQVLGRGGGFGSVYKGFITEDLRRNGLEPQPVSVRVVDGVQQPHKEWFAELMFLGHHSHPNVVKLIGYNCDDEHRILVYEYLALGSLENYLHSRQLKPLSWRLRMKVAYGIAKGLTYLHEAEKPLMLEKVTTKNILLDEDYNPKLSDFGYVRNGLERNISCGLRMVNGYEAPEFIMTGHLSTKIDVYSFGVVLLELLTGRKALDRSQGLLVQWARPFLEKVRTCHNIVDPRLKQNYPIEGVYNLARLTYQCLSFSGNLRPSMREVMEKLKPHLVTDGHPISSE